MRFLLLMIMLSFTYGNLVFSEQVENKNHNQAIKSLREFMQNDAARKAYAQKHPEAAETEKILKSFPPAIQKQMEEIVIMIIKNHGNEAEKFEKALQQGGPETAYNIFSPQIRNSIKAIASELETNEEFLKNAEQNQAFQKIIADFMKGKKVK